MACSSNACRLYLTAALITALLVPAARAQVTTLSGFVTDATDGQPLELVNVSVIDGSGETYGAATNADGLYLIPRLAVGKYLLQASFIGYETYTDAIELVPGEPFYLNISLDPSDEQLDEVVVESERTTGAARITAGQQTIRPRDIELIPAPDVSGDLANYLNTLPGVVAVGDRGGQLFIRGGEPTQNLVLIDGILVYQPFHILGFYSAFPSDVMRRTDIYAGGFGSRYGERLSSVIDVSTRNGNNQAYEGQVALSPFVSSLLVEGPIIKDRISLLASVRQSLVEQGASRLIDQPLAFSFGDVFAKVSGDINENSRASLLYLQTYDRGAVGEDRGGVPPEEVRWKNQAVGFRYLILPRAFPVTAVARASASRLETEMGDPDAPARSSTIENVNVAVDATFYNNDIDLDVGVSIRLMSLSSSLDGTFQNIDVRDVILEHGAFYAEPELELNNGLRIRPGVRLQFYQVRFHPYIEPRVRLIWPGFGGEWSAAVGRYNQAILGLNDRRDVANVFTVWSNVPTPQSNLDDIREGRAQEAWHGLVGYRSNPFPWLEWSVEGFYKYLSNLFISEWTAYPRFTTNLQPAKGTSKGFDVRVEVRKPSFYGYITYGYSATTYEAEQASIPIWYGTESLAFRPPHDRRHQLNAVLSTTLRGFELGLRWAFGSGLPYSRAIGFDGFALVDDVGSIADQPGSRRVIYERPYNATLPTYHRLDVSIDRTFEMGHAALTVQGSLINVYDRRNLFYLDLFTLRRVDQLPFIPSVGLKLAFR